MSLQEAYYHCFDPDPSRGKPAVREGRTMTCQHCGKPEFIPQAGTRADYEKVGGVCGHCWQFICVTCVRIGSCDPIEEKLRRAEEQALKDEQRYGVSKPFNPYRLPE